MMTSRTKPRSTSNKPIYIACVLLLTGILFSLQWVIQHWLYVTLYGVSFLNDPGEFPEYSFAEFWKGRVWYSLSQVLPSDDERRGKLMSFDPVRGGVSNSKLQIQTPTYGLVADGDRLWALSKHTVVKIEGDRTTEIRPKRPLTFRQIPFLYRGQVAVLDDWEPKLFVLHNNEWEMVGRVVIPFDFTCETIDGKTVLSRSGPPLKERRPLHDLQVVTDNDRIHLFVSNGSIVAYRAGLDLTPDSALDPTDDQGISDSANLEDWEVACPAPSNIGVEQIESVMGGVKGRIRAGLINGEPVLLVLSYTDPITFQGVSLLAYQRINGKWQKTAERPMEGMNELKTAEKPLATLNRLLTVTDGKKTYLAGYSISQTLKIYELTNTGFHSTGAVVKAPIDPIERWLRLFGWVFLPTVAILVWSVDRLTARSCESRYQFGLNHVELASLSRRSMARAIDCFLCLIPIQLNFWSLRFSLKELIVENMRNALFGTGAEGVAGQFHWLIFSNLLLGLGILVINAVFQGFWGVTPGKWICGIRTVRTTLSPCGFFRAPLRELCFLAESLFMLVCFLPILMIAFTSYRQRIGDMVADTIVIRKPSI